MQLTILKWTMVVPILLKILSVQADHQSNRNTCLKSESNLVHHLKPLVENSQHRRNGRNLDRRKIRRRMSSFHGSILDLDSGRIAEKLAKEALKSPEVQDTIRKLSNIKEKKNPLEIARVPAMKETIKGEGRASNSRRHGRRRKKKRKKHRKKVSGEPNHKEQVGRKGVSPKRTLGSRKSVHANFEPEIIKYNDANIKSKSEDSGVNTIKDEVDPNALNADVLKDILANRIQVKLREPENRHVRETLDNASLYRDDSIVGNAEEFSPDFQLLDDPLSSDYVGSITTEEMSLTDIIPQHLDPVTLTEVPTMNFSSDDKFSNDIPVGSLPEYNNPTNNTKLQRKLNNRLLVSSYNRKNEELSKNLRKISTESFDLDIYKPSNQKDPPPFHLPNPMEQPLGKVLESLGINVNENLKQKGNTASGISAYNPQKISTLSHRLSEVETLSDENYEEKNSEKPYLKTIQVFNDDSYNEQDKESVDITTESYEKTDFTKSNERLQKNQTLKSLEKTGSQTKEVAHEILDEIMTELHDIKSDHPKSNNEGSPCRLTGSWLTSQAGLKFDMAISNRTIAVRVSKSRVKAALLEIPVNSTWNVSGHAPFKVGAPFTLLAIDNSTKSMAVFVGSCRMCQGVDTIAGVWSVSRQPTDCRDFYISTSIFSDVFRRIRQLSHAKENGVITETKSTSTGRTKSTSDPISNDGTKD